MKNTRKTVLLTILSMCIMFLFTGCSEVQDEIMTSMVQWDLDSIYLNKHDDTYLELCDITKEEAEDYYADGIKYDADYFSYYWGITNDDTITYNDLDTKLQESIYNLCDTISKKSKYEVQSAAQQDDGSYSVKVVVEPIDIMEQANKLYDSYEPLNAFWTKHENVDFETISNEDYLALCNEYGYIMVDLMNELLPKLGYLEKKSLNIQVEQIDDLWTTNSDDLAIFNEYNVSYPY